MGRLQGTGGRRVGPRRAQALRHPDERDVDDLHVGLLERDRHRVDRRSGRVGLGVHRGEVGFELLLEVGERVLLLVGAVASRCRAACSAVDALPWLREIDRLIDRTLLLPPRKPPSRSPTAPTTPSLRAAFACDSCTSTWSCAAASAARALSYLGAYLSRTEASF